jgi:hypothetical protein
MLLGSANASLKESATCRPVQTSPASRLFVEEKQLSVVDRILGMFAYVGPHRIRVNYP